MERRIGILFTVIGAVIFVGIIGQFTARTLLHRAAQTDKAEEIIEDLSEVITSSYLAKGSFSTPLFTGNMRRYISRFDQLDAVVIFSSSSPHYIYAKDPGIIAFNPGRQDEWKGTAVFSVQTFLQKVETRPVSIPTQQGIYLSVVFTSISKDTLFVYLRDGLIGLGGLLLLIIIFLAVTPQEKIGKKPLSPPSRDTGETAVADTPAQDPAPVTNGSGSRTDTEKAVPVPEGSGLFSPRSGLGWEQYLDSRLSFELRRAASFDQDLVLILFRGVHLKNDNDKYKLIAQVLMKQFTFQDMLFEYKPDGFAVILPNSDLETAIPETEAVLKTICSHKQTSCELSAGLSSRNGRLITGNRLIAEASRALSKAFSDGDTKLLAFRSDPEKYRQFIASNM